MKKLVSLLQMMPALVVGVLFALLLGISGRNYAANIAHAQTAGAFLSGYAWSDNIGWIQMYNVDLLPDATTLSGYGWSSSIGWISFNQTDLSGCPSGTCKAWVSAINSKLTIQGWARACAGTLYGGGPSCIGTTRADGWDGWIALNDQSGNTYGPSLPANYPTGSFTGYSWGNEVVGWVDWEDVSLSGSITTDNTLKITATPSRLQKSTGVTTLTWTGANIPSTCTLSRTPTASGYPATLPSSPTTGNTTATGITQSTLFTVNCGTAGSASVTVGISPTFIEQ